MQLPAYPWQRERFWITLAGARREQIDAVGNSLLGRRLPALAPMPGVNLWASDLDPDAIAPPLRRRLAGAEILSAGVYAGLGLEAAASLDSASVSLRELVIHSDLVLSAAEPRATQVAIMPGPDRATVRMYSRASESQPWVEHSSARIDASDDSLPPAVDLGAVQLACATTASALPWLGEVGLGSNEALARLQPEGEEVDTASGIAAGLQLLELLAASIGARELTVARIDRLVHRGGAAPAWAYARLDQTHPDQTAGDVMLLDTSGNIVSAATGVNYCAPAPELHERLAQAQAAEWLYELAWRDLPSAQLSRTQRLLLFADRDGLGVELARLLAARGDEAILVYAGAVFGRANDGSYTIDPGSVDDHRRLLDELRKAGKTLDGAVYLWGIGPAASDSASGEELLVRQRKIAGTR